MVQQSRKNPRQGSEYGGVDGLIAPPPHDVADYPTETLMTMYGTNPAAGFPDGQNGETQDMPPETKKVADWPF